MEVVYKPTKKEIAKNLAKFAFKPQEMSNLVKEMCKEGHLPKER